MSTTATSAAAAASAVTTASSTTTKGKSSLGKDDFLQLLITQMKYQDPMNPMDGTQYAAQLAQFSSLEQLSNLNTNMTSSLDANYTLTQSVNNTMAASLIGKATKMTGSNFTVTNQANAKIGYTLPTEANTVSVKIYNSSGTLVKTIENCETSKGDHKLSWDLTDNNGNKLADGKYKFEVVAKASNKSDITATLYKYGNITGVKYTDSGMKILIDGVEYQLSDISEVLSP